MSGVRWLLRLFPSRAVGPQFDEQVLAWDRLVSVRPELGFIEIAVSDVPEPDNPAWRISTPPTPDCRPGSRCIAGPWNCAPARRSCCTH